MSVTQHIHEEEKRRSPPGQRDPNRLWCREHGVYEDECYICHPELKEKADAATGEKELNDHSHAGGDLHLWCNEHGMEERECGICQPQLASCLTPGQSLKIRLPSSNSAEKAGIRVAKPRPAEISAGFNVFCEARYNQNRLARISALVAGVIHSVQVDVGERVVNGELLVEVASPRVAEAKQEYLMALVTERLKRLAFEREKELVTKEISAAQSFQQAEAEYDMARIATLSARQKLINFGFTKEEADEVAETRSSSSIVHVHAPFAGTLVERSAVVGEAVEPGAPLFTLADLTTMWLTLSIPESQIALVEPGQQVQAIFAAAPGVEAEGPITWIDASVTEPSRMINARAEVANGDGRIRNNMFGEARILLRTDGPALTVPASSVQRFEQYPFVFVRLDEDLFELRRVILGQANQNQVQVIEGVGAEDPVVVEGSYTMLSEFLKSRLGAGCVDD